jgi:poly-gamma-glutamate capsule biosynthesis protein CapA/YwtB (metallophosphatase superfamily)
MKVFLCGDVMIGRGIDQVLPRPCSPELYEGYLKSALDYVRLAERANGPIAAPVGLHYVWGAALEQFERLQPDARIINLETSITHCDDFLPKGINYRASPDNAHCLAAAGIDCCVLANNHVLDWGRPGLLEALSSLDRMGIRHAGAGRDMGDAARPAVIDLPGKGRIAVYSFASETSGVPSSWAAAADRSGVNLLPDLSRSTAMNVSERIASTSQADDVVIASIHWGPNWGHEIPDEQRLFAHTMIDQGCASVVHGHSSHHAKAVEAYRDRLILYGCGDFLNDYEGIAGHEAYRSDLAVMYFAEIDPGSGRLVTLDMVPLQIRQFRLQPVLTPDVDWLMRTLDRESRKLGTRIVQGDHGGLALALAS